MAGRRRSVAGMTIALSIATIAVHDQDEALKFYRDLLGLRVTNDVRFESYRWLTVQAPDQPGVDLLLEHVGAGRGADDAAELEKLLAKGSLAAPIFRVDAVDELFERVRAAGYEVLQEPISQAYGMRDCAFRDPSGNAVRFAQPVSD